MMRKNVKRAPPKAKGGMSSLTMYRSRTSDLTALLYHSHVDRPSRELLTVALVLAALAGLGGAAVGAAGVPDRLDRSRELALARQARAQTGGELTADAYREMYALLDEEIVESLASGGPFASPGFLQERLDAFGDVWGGALLGVVGVDRLVVGAFRLADAPGVSTVRVYGRLRGEAALLATIHREGHPVVYPAAPAPDGAPQFVTAWEGASSGRGTRALRLELARQAGDSVRAGWAPPELVPDAGLRRRPPPELRAEPACDAPEDGPTPRTVSVPASEGRTPWELVFRRTADGWRLTRATQVLP